MNQKARHIGKRKVDSSARKRLRKLHTSEYENSCFTKKKIVLYFKEDTIDLEKLQSVVSSLTSQERKVQAAPSKREEKKSQEREREREEERVRTRKKKEKKKKKENEKENEKEEEKGKEERGKNGESGTKSFFEYTAPFRYIP